jgi:hypothetical protein
VLQSVLVLFFNRYSADGSCFSRTLDVLVAEGAWPRIINHADIDAFYTAIEQVSATTMGVFASFSRDVEALSWQGAFRHFDLFDAPRVDHEIRE